MSSATWFSSRSHSPTKRPRNSALPVVVSSEAYDRERQDVLLLAITSQQRPISSIFEVGVEHWQQAGLIKPSTFEPLVATIERPSIRKSSEGFTPKIRVGFASCSAKCLVSDL